MHSRCN